MRFLGQDTTKEGEMMRRKQNRCLKRGQLHYEKTKKGLLGNSEHLVIFLQIWLSVWSGLKLVVKDVISHFQSKFFQEIMPKDWDDLNDIADEVIIDMEDED